MTFRIPFIDLQRQYREIRRPVRSAINRVLESQHFVLKNRVRELEERVAAKLGVRHAVGVNSGSDALYLSLLALGVGPGDEVITTPFTFFATAGAISRTGARPVFVDIEPDTWNLDVSKIKGVIRRRTKAILPVHLFGLPCAMGSLMRIARKHSLAVLEDAAQSFGAKIDWKMTGSIGQAGCLSFYPTKNLGGMGDGGMVVTPSRAVAEKVRRLRDHGSRKKYFHETIGINSRLDELQAAVLLVKLKHVDHWNRLRRKHAQDYERGLEGLPVQTPAVPSGCSPVFHIYSILTNKRDSLAAFLKRRGVETGVYYPLPLHLQPCYRRLGYRRGDFPESEKVSRRILSLPMYPELTKSEKTAVIAGVRSFFKEVRGSVLDI